MYINHKSLNIKGRQFYPSYKNDDIVYYDIFKTFIAYNKGTDKTDKLFTIDDNSSNFKLSHNEEYFSYVIYGDYPQKTLKVITLKNLTSFNIDVNRFKDYIIVGNKLVIFRHTGEIYDLTVLNLLDNSHKNIQYERENRTESLFYIDEDRFGIEKGIDPEENEIPQSIIKIYNLDLELLQSKQTNNITDVKCNKDGSLLVGQTEIEGEFSITILDTNTLEILKNIEYDEEISSYSFHPVENILSLQINKKGSELYDLDNDKIIEKIDYNDAIFSATGKYLYTVSNDNTLGYYIDSDELFSDIKSAF